MNRRDFLAGWAGAAVVGPVPRLIAPPPRRADYTLTIGAADIEIAPGRHVKTIGYNGSVPGPLLRLQEGTPVTINVINDTDHDEFVHWHGLHIPSEVDGAGDEGTPPVPAHGSRQYAFTPSPAGFHWYHTHNFAGRHLDRGLYTGQFGFLMIDSRDKAARYDQEIFLALRDWNPYFSGGDDGFPMVLYTGAAIHTNGLAAGEPIRVRDGERILLHLLNASASDSHQIAFAGHHFRVVALDGNPVPFTATVEVLRIDPGERVDAVVEMSNPGVWLLGDTDPAVRRAGMTRVVEYAGRSGRATWTAPTAAAAGYLDFAAAATPGSASDGPVHEIPLRFHDAFHGHGALQSWTINGKSYPHTDMIWLRTGARYRLVMTNDSLEDHPIHLHRHTVELTRYLGTPTRGVRKDVVLVPAQGKVEVEFTADQPGRTLFHCHLQDHMDAGFMNLFDYR